RPEQVAEAGQRRLQRQVVQQRDGGDAVERGGGQRLGQDVGHRVVDVGDAGRAAPGLRDHVRGQVDARDVPAAGGQLAGEPAAAAADVERIGAPARHPAEQLPVVVDVVVPRLRQQGDAVEVLAN